MDWPDNEVPEGIGFPASKDDTTSAATSSAPGSETPPQGSDTPAASSSPADAGQPTRPDDGTIPKYRFDEVTDRFRTVAAHNAELQAQVRSLMEIVQRVMPSAVPPGEAAPQVKALDEREQRIVSELDRLIRHSPAWQQLQPLLERRDEVLGTAEAVRARSQQESEHWKHVATRTMNSVLGEFAKVVLGPDKTPQDLSPEQHRWAREAFSTWCQMDPSRVERYERLDPSLASEFVTVYRTAIGVPATPPITPEQRQAAAQTQRRSEAVRRLPTAGSASTPVGTPPAKINPLDEDAVHASGWQFAQAALHGSR